MRLSSRKTGFSGFTLVEVVVALLIVGILGGVLVASLAGAKSNDRIDRGVQMVHDDLLLIRSRAVTTNILHRVNFTSTTEWRVEAYNETTTAWESVGGVRQMPLDTYLTEDRFLNAGTNLQATPRGLFDFQGGASGDPYITVEGYGTSRTKSLNVSVGGAIEAQVN